ncbi:MAG: dimethylargininase [Streptosporangiales bacterium]
MAENAAGIALVRPVVDRFPDGIVTHIERQPVDVDRARSQHDAYVAALTGSGWSVRPVEAAPDHPDSVFVEDAVVVADQCAVLTRPGADERRGELDGVVDVVRPLGLDLDAVGAPGTLDGGDVLQIGDTVYVGVGGRTNGAGVRELRRALAPLGRTVVPVPLAGVLHLKSAVTALPDGSVVGLRGLVDERLFPRWRDAPEESGSHIVCLGGDRVLVAASAPETAEWLDGLGFDVVSVDIGEFEKLEGCVTCLSVLIPRP